jgi:hypothetical protein
MTQRLIIFGDSWPYGVGATDPVEEGFAALLGKKLNCPWINLSQPATSIDHATWQLIEFLKDYNPQQYQDKILFCLTGKARSWYFKKEEILELHPTNVDPTNKLYYSHIYSDQLGEAERIKNIILVEKLCEKYSLPVYFVLNWDDPPVHPLIDLNRFYPNSLLSLLDTEPLPEEKFIDNHTNNAYMTQFHPNDLGHQTIANALFNWIQQ